MDEEELLGGLGTGFGAVIGDDWRLYDDGEGGSRHEFEIVDWRGDSESDPLSQTSSSPHSALDLALNDECRPMCGRAGGGFAAIVSRRAKLLSAHSWLNVKYYIRLGNQPAIKFTAGPASRSSLLYSSCNVFRR